MLLVTFCLRLACGLLASLLLIPASVHPRFFRTQFLIALALTTGTAAVLWRESGVWLWLSLGGAIAFAFLGSLAWSLDGAPGGRTLIVLDLIAVAAALGVTAAGDRDAAGPAWLQIGDQVTSAALLGTATTAMLVGHSYLLAPTMAVTPLLRMLGALFATLLLRMVMAGVWSWTTGTGSSNLESDTIIWLLLRWGLGLVGPLVLGWMAWQSARIRSTQAATGILYVVVIFCFLGELSSQLLMAASAPPPERTALAREDPLYLPRL
jgi:hypothetical protein